MAHLDSPADNKSVITVAIDAMGGDFGPPVTIPAAVEALQKYPNLSLILVGDTEILKPALIQYQYDKNRLVIQHASERVGMDESPSQALRTKKDSSMRVAINLVKEGRADACVSAGNTGALMMTARFVLKTLPGIDRPAIIARFPTAKEDKVVRMLDLGANVDSGAENLLQFAVMGSVLASEIGGIQNPKVALLNIGEEEIKGNEQVKKTAELLSATKLVNFAGYIEGDKIMQGDIDVVVCDGFVGNVALKTIEGVARLVKKLIKESFVRNIFTRLIGILSMPILRSFGKRLNPGRHNGASLIGLQGIVIKSHGGADAYAFRRAIKEALISVEKNIPDRIRNEVEALLKLSIPPQGES